MFAPFDQQKEEALADNSAPVLELLLITVYIKLIMVKRWASRRIGFTVIELLIVITVIGILVTVSIVGYQGVQARGRDTRRKTDIGIIIGYLELYAADHQGQYPVSSGSTTINSGWSTTADSSWSTLVAALAPYGKIPSDPISTQGVNGIYSSNYAYFGGHQPTTYCNGKLLYLLTYQLEAEANVATGNCTVNPLDYSPGATTYRKISP